MEWSSDDEAEISPGIWMLGNLGHLGNPGPAQWNEAVYMSLPRVPATSHSAGQFQASLADSRSQASNTRPRCAVICLRLVCEPRIECRLLERERSNRAPHPLKVAPLSVRAPGREVSHLLCHAHLQCIGMQAPHTGLCPEHQVSPTHTRVRWVLAESGENPRVWEVVFP